VNDSRTIVITGASDGIGEAAARSLTRRGHRVVVVGRTPAKVERVASELGVEGHVADFSRFADVEALAARLRADLPRIDVLAHNAGGVFPERRTTEDGHEITLQVNHLAPFLLTSLLLDRLIADRASVISTSSAASYRGRLDLADLQLRRGWSPWRAYANAKLANIVFTRGLHRRSVLDGVSAAAFHPGVVATNFGATSGPVVRWAYGSAVGRRVMLTPEAGADTLGWLADGTPPRDWAPGGYFTRRQARRPHRQALDDVFARAFWDASAGLGSR